MPQPSRPTLEAFAAERLERLEAAGLRRSLTPTLRNRAGVDRAGRRLVSFCDNDYLGLSTHPDVIAAASDAAIRYGAGAGAARLVSGDCPLNAQLEQRLARIKGLPAARVFGSGYLANIGTIPALAGAGDVIAIDELAHACMHAGARLSGAEVRVFKHNDVAATRGALDRPPGVNALLLTETVFSMDGDIAPLADLHAVCAETGAWMMTDDAHGFGVVPLDNPAEVQMGTLSKAAGSYGGYVCGPESVIDLLTSRARSFVYTTGLPPPVLAASIAALDVMQREPQLSVRARRNAALFCDLIGIPAPQSTIVPLIIGESDAAMQAARALEDQGFLVAAIRPPTVPAGTARLRVTFSATHGEADIRRLAQIVSGLLTSTGTGK